ncbi:synaptotagmin-1 [Hydra vulgaris]|uniref:Synaptotagmin-1 n=1 Tax=Hydra vulgaris TaxID=6087 RepID=A0ABM4CYU8_HYDVU
MVVHKTLKLIIWEHLEKLPWSPWITIFTVLGLVLGGILIPLLIKKFCFESYQHLIKEISDCLIKTFKRPEPADAVDLAKLQLVNKTFYEKVQPSTVELQYSGFIENEPKFSIVPGKVRFSLEYDEEAEVLKVTIIEAQNLPAADEGGASDPYIRVMLKPDTRRRYETIVLDKTLNPKYDQTFEFKKLPISELLNRTLSILAIDFDQLPEHDILGMAEIPMIDFDLSSPVEVWRTLIPGYDLNNPGEFIKAESDYGDICIGLMFMPATEKLHVYIIECKDLKSVDDNGKSDPFVKITMFQKKKKIKTFKTRHIKETLTPYFNEDFVFNLSPALTPVTDLQFIVLDYELFGTPNTIGQVTIGASSYGPQMRHWRDVLLAPKKSIACWHMLRAKSKPGEDD